MISDGEEMLDSMNPIQEYSQIPCAFSEACMISRELIEALPRLDQVNLINSLLRQFTYKSTKPLKKEYVRVNIIRMHKKIIRSCLSTGPALKRFCKTLKKMPYARQDLWKPLSAFIDEHRESLKILSNTANGPITDGKSKANKEEIKKERSFNTNFCKKYFSENYVRESFYLFIEYLFADLSSEKLCLTFRYYCCDRVSHSEQCASNWLKMKEFFQITMFEDLELMPVKKNRINYELFYSTEGTLDDFWEDIEFFT